MRCNTSTVFFLCVWIFHCFHPGISYLSAPRILSRIGSLWGKLADEERFIQIYERVTPSVVYISTLNRLFNPVQLNVFEIPSQSGSGFVWDDKFVVTNAHVLETQGRALSSSSDDVFLVTFLSSNKSTTTFRSKIKGISSEKDIAVLELAAESKSFQPLEKGTSSTLRVGQYAIAVGNPFGLDLTLTTGVVSGLGRTVGFPRTRSNSKAVYNFDMIQCDASINPGNSGGPLLDSDGLLIGMNTAIYTTSGSSSGISFAIPVDTLKIYVPLLINNGEVKPTLGLGVSFLGGYAARAMGVSNGLLVTAVEKGTPADFAGLRPGSASTGDIILKCESVDLEISADFDRMIQAADVGGGAVVKLLVSRNFDGGRRQLEVRLRLR